MSVGHLCAFLGKKIQSGPLPISAPRTGGKGVWKCSPSITFASIWRSKTQGPRGLWRRCACPTALPPAREGGKEVFFWGLVPLALIIIRHERRWKWLVMECCGICGRYLFFLSHTNIFVFFVFYVFLLPAYHSTCTGFQWAESKQIILAYLGKGGVFFFFFF